MSTSTRDDEATPPLAIVTAALRKTTERLAREIAQPTADRPDWNAFEWRVAQAVAALHGISALLYDRLRWRGPAHWNGFLEEQRLQGSLREAHVRQTLARIEHAARAAGIPVVQLKGAALLDRGLYAAGTRPMGDIDLLIREADLRSAELMLEQVGYIFQFGTRRHVVLQPVHAGGASGYGEHIDNPIKIELHTRIAEPLPFEEIDITGSVLPSQPEAGLLDYPSIASLMRHLLLHASGNVRARALRLVQLHDIAALATCMKLTDWSELVGTAPGDVWWAWPPLSLTARYYPESVPEKVLNSLQPHCPGLLQRMTARHSLVDVSWSNARVRALPGIEWSRSPIEALRFARTRIWPDRAARQALALATENVAYGSYLPWYDRPHLERIARWMLGRAPRVQTMYAVHSALAQARAHPDGRTAT